MDTRKVNKINWWNEKAVKEPMIKKVDVDGDGIPDKVIVDQRQAMQQPIMPQVTYGAGMQGVPFIQPLVIVPFSSPNQPIYHQGYADDMDIEEDFTYEDLYPEDEDEYILDDIMPRKAKKAKKNKR